MSALGTASRAHLRSLRRQPTTVAMILCLPPVVVEVYGRAMATFPTLPMLSGQPGTVGRVSGALFAASFLAALVGLFQVIGARSGDERLAICGFDRSTLLASRLVTVAAVAVLAAVISLAVLAWQVSIEAPVLAFGALLLGALIYGLLGMVVGAVLPRELEGSLVLVFLADIDNFLASGLVEADLPVTDLFPLVHPHALLSDAVQAGQVDTGDALVGVAWVAVLLVAGFAAYARTAGGVDA